MKRVVIFALPVLATMAALAVALLLYRPPKGALGLRIAAARATVAGALDPATDTLEEVLE
jgi:hypothetical protein